MTSSLYDKTPEPEAPAKSDAPASSTASALYGKPDPAPARTDTPPEVAESRKTVERGLYGDTTFVQELPDDAIEGLDAREARLIAADVGASADDVRAFRTMLEQHVKAPASAEQRAAWRDDTLKLLEGNKVGAAEFAAADRLAGSDPRLAALLKTTGYENEPKTVMRFVELARSMRGRR